MGLEAPVPRKATFSTGRNECVLTFNRLIKAGALLAAQRFTAVVNFQERTGAFGQITFQPFSVTFPLPVAGPPIIEVNSLSYNPPPNVVVGRNGINVADFTDFPLEVTP